MPLWAQIIVSVFSLTRTLLGLLRDREATKQARAERVYEFRKALNRARKEGKTDDIEKLFRSLDIDGR